MQNIVFILAVCSRVEVTSSLNIEKNQPHLDVLFDPSQDLNVPPVRSSSHSPSRDSQGNKMPERFLGKVVLGCGVKGDTERAHWQSVITQPRKVISEWHALK